MVLIYFFIYLFYCIAGKSIPWSSLKVNHSEELCDASDVQTSEDGSIDCDQENFLDDCI